MNPDPLYVGDPDDEPPPSYDWSGWVVVACVVLAVVIAWAARIASETSR